jgi:S1-C subfamily serine protease
VVAGESYTLGGDLIVAVAGQRVSSLEELRDVLADHKPGEKVTLEIYRGNREQTLDVTLGRQPVR